MSYVCGVPCLNIRVRRHNNGDELMNRATEVITRKVLRAEKNMFIFRVTIAAASYVGITFWLNAIRQTAATWFLWCLVGSQLFLFLTIFVVCSLRLRQCRRHTWWLWFPLLLSRVENWEVVLIPAATIVTLILSEVNVHVSEEGQRLLRSVEDETGTTLS